MRKTKIVCTLGPATSDVETIKELMRAGMNVARFNFSHGTHEEQLGRLDLVRTARDELAVPVATMIDTKGPEIRVGLFEKGAVELVPGGTFTLTARDISGTEKEVSVSYKELPEDVSIGTRILIDDGLIELVVVSISGEDIHCKVITGGRVSNRKSINIPSVQLTLPYMTEQDRSDIIFGIENEFDFLAASFVRNASDVLQIRALYEEVGKPAPMIISKIENEEGVTNIDEILAVSDGVMVARGDLGVEIPFEDIPAIQKMIINKAYLAGKPAITATQMLDSMIKNPRPTRAEVTDVANAVYDGTSAVMLSGETAAGDYPVLAVATMAKIAIRTEQNINYKKRFIQSGNDQTVRFEDAPNITDAIAHATCGAAHDLRAARILSVTKSGITARHVSKYRPAVPIIGCTPDARVYRQLALSWGVIPYLMPFDNDETENPVANAIQHAVDSKLVNVGDLIVVTAGLPFGVVGSTNFLRVHIVEESIDFPIV